MGSHGRSEVIEGHGLAGCPSDFTFPENWLVHLLLLFDLSFSPRVLRSSQKASPLALALGEESVSGSSGFWQKSASFRLPFHFPGIFPVRTYVYSSSILGIPELLQDEAQGRRGKQFSAEFQGQLPFYHQDQGANSRPSYFPPVLRDLVLSTPSSSCYLCTGILLLHLPLLPKGKLMQC